MNVTVLSHKQLEYQSHIAIEFSSRWCVIHLRTWKPYCNRVLQLDYQSHLRITEYLKSSGKPKSFLAICMCSWWIRPVRDIITSFQRQITASRIWAFESFLFLIKLQKGFLRQSNIEYSLNQVLVNIKNVREFENKSDGFMLFEVEAARKEI